MTRTRATIVTAGGGLALAVLLGAGPATQPTRTAAAAAGSDRENVLGPITTRDLALVARPADPAPFPVGSRVIVPPRLDGMPNASVYLTPRAQWIPRKFNGGTFYLIPCEKTESANGSATPAPSPTPAGRATVEWGRLLAPPSTQPTSAAPAR